MNDSTVSLMLCMHGEPDQLPYLPQISALGAGIELGSYGLKGVRSPADWAGRLALHKAVRAHFQGPIAIHGPFVGMEFAHMDHLVRAAVERRLDMTFEAAVTLQADRVILHSGFTPVIDLFGLQEDWLARSTRFWHEEIRRWAGAGIQVVLENDVDRTPDWVIRLVEAVDNPFLGLCLDIGHLHVFSDLPAAEWVRRMGTRLYHVHLHDNDGVGDRHWPLGQGHIDFEPFYAALHAHVPQVTLSLEVNAPMEIKMGGLYGLVGRFGSGE